LPAIAPFDASTARKHQKAWANHLGVQVEMANSIGMKFVLIPPGEFEMGSPKELIEEERARGGDKWFMERLPGEGPQHRVRITRPFWLGVTEVTQKEYQRVTGSDPSDWRGDARRPVGQVSWNDAMEFCRRLTELPEEKVAKRQYGLPTEAQWEYACRAGNPGPWFFSPQPGPGPAGEGEKLLAEYGWFVANSDGQPHPVGQKRVSPWGLYDVYGNEWEWCQDWYDPPGPSGGSHRVLRGGGWDMGAAQCRSAHRLHFQPDFHAGLGFRVARTLAP
jgi:formylglycine-generating enzyme required for sulfatase activity